MKMKLILGALALPALARLGNAQEVVNGARTILGRLTSTGQYAAVDFSGAGSTAPVKTGTLAARPVVCTSGQMYFATDAAAGQNLSYCVPPGAWSSGAAAGGVCQLASALGFALNGTDETTMMNAVLANFYAAGGGCLAIDQNRTLRVDGQIILPHGAGPNYFSPPYRITGGGHAWGGGDSGSSYLDLRYAGSANGSFKFQHVGAGEFEMDHVTVKDSGSDCNPYFVLNGNHDIHEVTFLTSAANTGCNTILTVGGTNYPFNATTWDGTYNAWFWGQGNVHHSRFVGGRALLAQNSVNGVVFDNNLVSGPTTGGVAIIDFEGHGSGTGASRASVISNNTFEVLGATCSINLHGAENTVITGNGFWDGASSTYGVCGDSTATKNVIDKSNYVDISAGTGFNLVNPSFMQSNNYFPYRAVPFFFDGGGSALSGTITRCALVPFGGLVNQFSMAADQSGSATVTVKAVALGSYTGPGSAIDISNGGEAMSGAVRLQDTTLTGWNRTIAPNTMLCFTLSSPSTATWLSGNVQVWEGR